MPPAAARERLCPYPAGAPGRAAADLGRRDGRKRRSLHPAVRRPARVPASTQTGLAIDLGRASEHIDFIRPDFPTDGVCGAFRRLAARYGFIERYPRGREAVTRHCARALAFPLRRRAARPAAHGKRPVSGRISGFPARGPAHGHTGQGPPRDRFLCALLRCRDGDRRAGRLLPGVG